MPGPAERHGTEAPEGFQSGGGTSAPSSADWQAIAQALGVDPARAKSLITSYRAEHGGTWSQAVSAVASRMGGGGGGSGDGSGGGGGGGSSASSRGPSFGTGAFGSPNRAEAMQNAAAGYLGMLQGWGIPIGPETQRFVQQALQANMNSAAFLQALRKTKFYAQRFPGIMRKDGSLRMTESQYIAGFQSAKDFAASVGRNLSRDAYGMAIKNGNSPSELRAKVEALDLFKQHGMHYKEFGQYLVATGQAKKVPTKEELLKFIMKQGPREWEQTYETVVQATEIEKLGITVGRPGEGNEVSYKTLKQLQKQLGPEEEPDFQVLIDKAKILGASRLYKLGITTKDLLKVAYKHKDAVKIANRIELALGTAEATATEQRAAPGLGPEGQDMGRPRLQATE